MHAPLTGAAGVIDPPPLAEVLQHDGHRGCGTSAW